MIMSLLTCLISASRTCCSSSIVGLRSIINSAWQCVHNHRSDKRKCWKLPGCCPPVASQPAAWCLGPAPAPLLPTLRAETPAPALSLVSLLRLRQRSELSPHPHTLLIYIYTQLNPEWGKHKALWGGETNAALINLSIWSFKCTGCLKKCHLNFKQL